MTNKEIWIKNRAEEIAEEMAQAAVQSGLFSNRGFYSAIDQARNFYRRAYVVGEDQEPAYPALALFPYKKNTQQQQTEAERLAEQEYNSFLNDVVIPFDSLPNVTYDQVKQMASALIEGDHGEGSFFYEEMLHNIINGDYTFIMSDQLVYMNDYTNISGKNVAEVSIVFIPTERGPVAWNDNYTVFYYIEEYNKAKAADFDDDEIFGE